MAANVVINELHYDPDVKTEPVEFVELHNAGDAPADLSRWTLADGISFTFPQGTELAPGAYLVIAQNPAAVQQKFGVPSLGPFTGKLANEGERLVLLDALDRPRDEVTYQLGFPWPTVGDAPGNSIELVHPALDNDLAGSWRSSRSGPTPGAANSRAADNVAPQMRQVRHEPNQARSGQDVRITAKITDADGVSAVALSYQIVRPGDYIAIDDPRYQTDWTSVVMRDDGSGGDDGAGDDVYTVVVPGNLKLDRHLVRYRITATDAKGLSVTGPYEDDPTPNFTYYVYDGVPDWTASIRPGVEPAVTYRSSLLESLPVYQFITTHQAHADALQLPGAQVAPYEHEEYLWHGALVYDGEVYDHIRFRSRGGVNRFARGKNAWKFDFNRGHELEARDNYGRKYATTWDKLNLAHIANPSFRGEHEMVEALSYRMFNLAAVESPNTHFIHFRIVQSAEENPSDQYSTDFQGLYLAVEQPDGRMLDEHGLADGNLYKIDATQNPIGTLNNQGPTQPADASDLIRFVDAYNDRDNVPTEQWWRDNLDLHRYYSYRSIVEAVRQYDIAGTNQFYYHNPGTNKWSVHPWDLDLTWRGRDVFGNGADAFNHRLTRFDALSREYHNRLREILDLLFNHDQTDMLIEETARFIHTPGQLSFTDADRAMWDYNPIVAAAPAGQVGQFYNASPTKDFAGMVELMKGFIDTQTNLINRRILRDEDLVPETPRITYVGDPNYALNRLVFQASPFNSPAGAAFKAIQWRIAEVTDPGSDDFDPSQRRKYEIESAWESEPLATLGDTVTIPSGNLQAGRSYRVRARVEDAAGFWSHWSSPIQVVTGPGKGALVAGLRITEINYHPHDPELDSGHGDEDFEFIELQNVGSHTLDLGGVTFTDGVQYAFAPNTLLQPGQRILVVANRDAFQTRYGTGLNIAGTFTSGRLSNGGERIAMTTASGEMIQQFTYDDQNPWPTRADGQGRTLEVNDTSGDYDYPRNWRASHRLGGSPGNPAPVPGDATGDGVFNSLDLVKVLQAGQYEDAIANNSTFAEGDWDGDGDFTARDLVLALEFGSYVGAGMR
jgi:hypothetical protein